MEDLRRDIGLLLLRASAGSMMLIVHGLPKLLNFSKIAPEFADPLGVGNKLSLMLAIFAEVFCSFAVIVGLFTRLAVLPLLFTMGIAFFVIHADDPFQKRELALMYSIPFLTLLLTGAGNYSVDRSLGIRKRGSV